MKEIRITGIDAIAYVAAAMNSDILYKTSCLIYKYLLLRTLFYPHNRLLTTSKLVSRTRKFLKILQSPMNLRNRNPIAIFYKTSPKISLATVRKIEFPSSLPVRFDQSSGQWHP
jgi:hypothetical protein